jgi:hypothetical protein
VGFGVLRWLAVRKRGDSRAGVVRFWVSVLGLRVYSSGESLGVGFEFWVCCESILFRGRGLSGGSE